MSARQELAALKKKVAIIEAEAGRDRYARGRMDTWLDEFPAGIASALGVNLSGFKSGRWSSTGTLGIETDRPVARITVDASNGNVLTLQPLRHTHVGMHVVYLDSTPDVADLTPRQLADLEAWYRYADTGVQFDPVEAAKAINALGMPATA